jgi:RNA polymerase sigma-70 factor (ECF subfamily)
LTHDFLQVYEEYVWRIYGYFAYRLRSRADAEDLTQLTFERAFAAWDRYDPDRAEVSTWLFAIARNALTDHSRRVMARPRASRSIEDVSEGELPTTEGPEERLGMDPALAAALGRLSRRERGVLALRFGGDLRGAEIAELTGLSVANVHQILSRALRRMRSLLETEREQERQRDAEARGSADPPP